MTKSFKIVLIFIFCLFSTFILNSCTMNASIQSIDGNSSSSSSFIILKLSDAPIELEINEGSSILLLITQSTPRNKDTEVELQLHTSSNDGVSNVFQALIVESSSQGKMPFKIAANQTVSNVSLDTIYNATYTGDRVFTLSFSTNDSDVVNRLPEIKIKVKDLEKKPNVNIATPAMTLNESSGFQTVLVTLDQASSSPISVNYSFPAGTATLASDYEATSGVLNFAPGETAKIISFNILEDVAVETGVAETFFVRLDSVLGEALVGNNNQIIVNIVDNDTENFSISNSSAIEGSNMVFTVSLSNSSTSVVTVNYMTVDGTALSGTHYVSKSGTLSFAVGETVKTISVATIANTSEVCANNKTFNVQLSNAIGASIAVSSAIGAITDPDIPVLNIANNSQNEGSAISFTVSLSAVCNNKNISFNYTSSSNTAIAGLDYVAVNSSAVINAGNMNTSISVSILQDFIYEGNENFNISISNPSNATIGSGSAVGTIIDDELAQGAFNISGITGAGDSLLDGYLSSGVQPVINWQASTNSTSYDVTIFENDGSTVKCSTQNTAGTYLDFGGYSCNLTLGITYKVKVAAKVGGQTLDAANSLYSFYTNRPPLANSDQFTMLKGDMEGYILNPLKNDSDPDNQSLTIISVSSPTHGSAVISNNNIVYTLTDAAYVGTDTFTYTLADPAGETSSSTIQMTIKNINTWLHRKKLSISSTLSPNKPLSNYTFLLQISGDSDLASKALSSGGDIVFTMLDGLTPLRFDVESYSSTTGDLLAWIKIPTLPQANTFEFYMYYGESTVTNMDRFKEVYNSNYLGVWHMSDNASVNTDGRCIGENGYLCESTSNNRHAWVNQGTIDISDLITNGKIGRAIDFDSATIDHIKYTCVGCPTTYPISVSTWFNAKTLSGILFTYGNLNLTIAMTGSYLHIGPGGFQRGALLSIFSTNTWYHITAVYASATDMKLYVNGIDQTVVTNDYWNASGNNMGSRGSANCCGSALPFNGQLDEVRLMKVVLDANDVDVQYRNQLNPSAYITS